jgi:hypothetical protein
MINTCKSRTAAGRGGKPLPNTYTIQIKWSYTKFTRRSRMALGLPSVLKISISIYQRKTCNQQVE